MQNWIQEIIPQIKDKNGNITARQDVVIANLKEADLYWRPGQRNMAGDMFESIASYKYAASFMADLKARIYREFRRDVAARLTSKEMVVDADLQSTPAPRPRM